MSGGERDRAVRFAAATRWLALVALAVATAHGVAVATARSQAAPAAQLYQCPMHPQVRAGAAGVCPLCGMALEPVRPVPRDEQARAGVTLDSGEMVLGAVRLTAVTPAPGHGWWVPSHALLLGRDGPFVLVTDKGALVRRRVRPLRVDGARVVVDADGDMARGARVVADGAWLVDAEARRRAAQGPFP